MAFGPKKDRPHYYHKKPEIPRGLDAPPYLKDGEMLDGRYKIDTILGRGGFGQVFQAKDMVTKQYVAVKVEPRDRHSQINTERMVLLDLTSCKHVPNLIDSGYTNELCFLVLPVYSDNLFELRKFAPDLRFPVKFALGVFYQLVETLQEIHTLGYMHRDIKPSNICLGRLPDERTKVFLIDFGMSRRFRTLDGKLIERRDNVPFRGTSRYCSKRVHLRYDQGPCDDMCSLLFGVVEMMEGDLPWKGDENDRMLATIKAKPIFKFDKFTKFTPIPLFHIAHYIQQCTYEHELRYDIIKRHINEALRWLLENEDIDLEERERQVAEFIEDHVLQDRKKVVSVEDSSPPFPATQASIHASIMGVSSKASIIQRQENRKVEYDWVKPASRDVRRNTRDDSFYVQTVRHELDEARRNFVMGNISDQKMVSPVQQEVKACRNGSAMDVESCKMGRNGHGDQHRQGRDRFLPQEQIRLKFDFYANFPLRRLKSKLVPSFFSHSRLSVRRFPPTKNRLRTSFHGL
ncbi:unnamed protein product [Bursaphelenchus xylophilus]|uniref:non-specific serine/threonine protein kinase n=1 Tax=Bursaphelenchus xylophilus TaxID=6326 RepID=A0A7I8WFV7_BURXY|nr:unnamed protein product [Bursaphelenchus xylophilus]CAG9111845.1 unnamed protein product [Bursaphelenchus xylophilus]